MSLRRLLVSWLLRGEVGATEKEWRDVRLSFSQYGEDLLVQQILSKDHGTYLDIGANHPVRFSNTYHLYRFRQWKGILVEPNPVLADLARQRRPRDVVLQAAVGPAPGMAFFENNPEHTLSRILPNPKEAHHEVLEVPVISMAGLIDRFPSIMREVEFLNVDCEGMDLDILSGNRWEIFHPLCICAESAGPNERLLTDLMQKHGYRLEAKAGHSRIFTRAGGDR